jgi:YYY domain-containing protein
MFSFIVWLLAVEAIGLAAFPICYFLFPRLKDRGYSVSKVLGLLIIGYLSWVLSALHIVPSVQATLFGLLLLMAAVSAWYVWRRRREFGEFFYRERTTILLAEGVFLAVLLVWTVYRAYDPAINHTEQPMDFAFLNASIRNFLGQPEDPWLRGESISYYYFGYWMMGALSELTAIPSNVTYNLSMALIPALASMGIFGLVYGMVRSEARRLRYAIAAGVAAAVLIGFAANLEGVLEFMRANQMGSDGFWDWLRIAGLDGPAAEAAESWRPTEHWWWWKATRVVSTFGGDAQLDYTIHEFPFFSFMLGDMHPHVMSLPFVVLFLTMCWNLFQSPVHVWSNLSFRPYAGLLALALVLGGVAFTNMWDLPVLAALLLGVLAVRSYLSRGGDVVTMARDSLPVTGAVVAVAAILVLPYLLSFTSQVSGINPVGSYEGIEVSTTRPVHTFIVWGLLLLAVSPFVVIEFWRTTVSADWGRLTTISLTVAFAPFALWAVLHLDNGGGASEVLSRFFHILPYALLIGMAVYTVLWLARRPRPPMGRVFALALTSLGLLIIMGPELLYVDDSFGGASERMNTVFKLYYQGWLLLGAAAGFTVYYWVALRERLTGWTRFLTGVWSTAFVVLLLGSAYYPLVAAASKGDLFHDNPTLDGLAWVGGKDSAEYRAIKMISREAGPDSAVLEAFDGSSYYVTGPFGRVSASTGVPTVLGWQGHENQWRGSDDAYKGRPEDVETIYTTDDVEEAKNLLSKYGVDYVYVGPMERQKYGEDGLDKFATFMELRFSEGGVSVYRWRP